MVSYSYQFRRNQIREALMHNNVVENVIATIIVGALSTVIGLILRAFGFSTEESINVAALFALLGFVLLFLVGRKLYLRYKNILTVKLLEQALNVDAHNVDEVAFKNQIVEKVLLEQKNSRSIREFPNQMACESHIRKAAGNAKKVKILTIRGEKYFLGGPNSLLYDSLKRTSGSSIEVLVLSPESDHITDEHARDLGHRSAEEIRQKMRITLGYLKHIVGQNKNFEVRCYNEAPNFKILIFDGIMFISTFAAGGPKNDQNVKMLRLTREGEPLFLGFERYFDDLWKRSNRPM